MSRNEARPIETKVIELSNEENNERIKRLADIILRSVESIQRQRDRKTTEYICKKTLFPKKLSA